MTTCDLAPQPGKHSKDTFPAIEDDLFYDTVEAGKYLGFQATTLRNSRSTGRLAGVSSPIYVKLGTVVRYRGKSLKQWRSQFEEICSNAVKEQREETEHANW